MKDRAATTPPRELTNQSHNAVGGGVALRRTLHRVASFCQIADMILTF